MALWLQVLVLLVGAFHAVASFFFFSRGRRGVAWALAWVGLALATAVAGGAVALAVYAALVLAWHGWWLSLRPRLDRDWADELRYQATGEIVGERLLVRHVRNFRWRGEADYDEVWETRAYDLGRLATLDLFACYWTSPAIAHLIVSFGFADQGQLAFSIEIRRERGEPWSGVGGIFKVFELVTIVADERDVVRVRTSVRGEDVRLYRLRSTPEFRRRLLAAYIADCNRLAHTPRFFHTFFTNCTTQVVRLVRAAGQQLPLDWRMIVSGYIPDYLHRVGLLADRPDRPFVVLQMLAAISAQAQAFGDGPGFSAAIREGVPAPE
jgi:hypothetical protein